ncbi:MAG: M14 family zinc carboxypeptidase [Pseudomonadota bacterium]
MRNKRVHRYYFFSINCLLLLTLLSSSVFANEKLNVTPEIAESEALAINKACKTIAKKLASVSFAECSNLNLQPLAFSQNQFPLLLKEFPPLGKKQPKGKVLLIGGIHGDEYSSISVTFKWLNILTKHHSGLFHWKISPLVNPDGLLRKKSQRTNSNQVDLNRNFPSSEEAQAHIDYWEKETHSDPRRYPGTQPLSEKETQWLSDLINQFKPDVIVSVHAPFGLVDFDGQANNTPTKKAKPPSHLGPLHLHLLGTYPGSLGRYGSEIINIPVITVELEYAGIMPSNHDINKIWVDLVAWLRKYLSEQRSSIASHPVATEQ